MKLVFIMVLLIVALMTVVGSFLINGVGNFYIERFYIQMEQTFSEDFITQLRDAADQTSAPERLKEQIMAQTDLGVDISGRNIYVLDRSGRVLAGSDQTTELAVTENILTAMNGAVGQESSIAADYMDLAIPIETEDSFYIAYVLDNKSTVDSLTGEVMAIILRSLAFGLVICVILAFVLAQILITPIQALTDGTRQVASGDFSQKLEVTSRDEIGVLTRNFNNMSQVLQNTLTEVENERNKLSTLFLHMTDGVVAFDAQGMAIHYNPAAVQMLARPIDPTVRYEELFGDAAAFADVLALHRPQFIEAQKHVGDRELELFLAPYSAEQTAGGALVLIHDVTEQRRADEMRREFVANVSHELRTPLTNVKSYAETIVDSGDELPAELRENFMGVILNETDRMTRIVQDLLTLSKFDYGKMEMNVSRFAFANAVRNVSRAVSIDAQNHGHTLTVEMPDELPMVDGDRERIEQVIMNIVSNAIKYTPDGGKIDLRADTDGKNVWLIVADNGIGIPEKDLPRLFERFYRVDKARSRQSGGTGLGLSIAQEILNQHHGEIKIESVYGEGTTVTITLPVAPEAPENPEEQEV
jgi:two-component system sensor histidine kinase VicK